MELTNIQWIDVIQSNILLAEQMIVQFVLNINITQTRGSRTLPYL